MEGRLYGEVLKATRSFEFLSIRIEELENSPGESLSELNVSLPEHRTRKLDENPRRFSRLLRP